MHLNLRITAVILVLALVGCKKSDAGSSLIEPEKPAEEKLQNDDQTGDNSSFRTYTNFVNLIQLPNGDYTDGHIIFNQIIYRTGDYLDGEGVTSINFYFDPVVTPNVLWSSSVGPFFTYVQGTPMGGAYTPSFINDWNSYGNALNDFLDDNVDSPGIAFPNPDDYLPSAGNNGELITKGFVVRRHSSPTTFAIAPASFKPLTGAPDFVPDEVEEFMLGSVQEGSYAIDVKVIWVYGGVPNNGALYDIDVFANGQPVTINGFVGSYEKLPNNQGYSVTGEFTLPNGTIVSFSGVANGV